MKNNSDAPLHMDPNESFVVKVLDKDGNSKWNNSFNLSIELFWGRTARLLIFSPSSRPGLWVSTKSVSPLYASSAPQSEETLEFIFIPRQAKQPELRITWKIPGTDLVKSNEGTGK